MMEVKKLNQAYQEANKLVDFLVPRGWYKSAELTVILERADKKIAQIVEDAINEVIERVEGQYLEEAQTWANNSMTGMDGKRLLISKAEQRKAQRDADQLQKAVSKLRDIK